MITKEVEEAQQKSDDEIQQLKEKLQKAKEESDQLKDKLKQSEKNVDDLINDYTKQSALVIEYNNRLNEVVLKEFTQNQREIKEKLLIQQAEMKAYEYAKNLAYEYAKTLSSSGTTETKVVKPNAPKKTIETTEIGTDADAEVVAPKKTIETSEIGTDADTEVVAPKKTIETSEIGTDADTEVVAPKKTTEIGTDASVKPSNIGSSNAIIHQEITPMSNGWSRIIIKIDVPPSALTAVTNDGNNSETAISAVISGTP